MNLLKVMSAIAVKAPLESLVAPNFEAASGGKLSFTWEPTTVLLRQIQEGERADIIIAIDDALDKLAGDGVIEVGSRVKVACAVLGVAVRRGEPHPDISTTASFAEALTAAEGVAFS